MFLCVSSDGSSADAQPHAASDDNTEVENITRSKHDQRQLEVGAQSDAEKSTVSDAPPDPPLEMLPNAIACDEDT